ncbi:MAG: hypothetical protein ACYCPO_07220 [Acidobacteriaceae bacterium]
MASRNHFSKQFPLFALLLIFLFAGSAAFAQQKYVGRYDVYTGFADLNTPALGLNQPGFHTQVGLYPRAWYSLGLDYSVFSGSELLKPDLLPTALQQELAPIIIQYMQAGVIPPTYQLTVPTNVFTQTFAAGPQLAYRHFSRATLYLRPSLGAFRLGAAPRPTNYVATVIAKALVPSGHKVDWTGFYGIGGGAELKITRHLGLMSQLDIVYNHPFNDILANGVWTERYSIGPLFHFGRNVVADVK